MSVIFVGGERFNALESGLITPSPTAASLFPATGLYDGDVSATPFKFSAAGADATLTIDTDLLQGDGDMEAGIGNWTDGSTGGGSSIAAEGTIVHAGSGAMKATNGGDTYLAYGYRDFTVRPGWTYAFSAWMRSDGTATATLRIQNRTTAKFWTGSAWQHASADLDTEAGTSYAQTTSNVAIESLATVNASTCTLRVWFANETDAACVAYLDDVVLYPIGLDLCSIHGHNIPPGLSVQFRSSTDNFGGSDDLQATFTLRQPAMYVKVTAPDARYFRLKFVGTSLSALGLGQVVLTKAATLTRQFIGPYDYAVADRQVRTRAPFGAARGDPIGDFPSIQTGLEFQALTEAQHLEVERDLHFGTRQGAFPLLFIPSDAEAPCHFGRLDASPLPVSRPGVPAIWRSRVTFVEDPFPVWGA